MIQKKQESIALAEVIVFKQKHLQIIEDAAVSPFVSFDTVRKHYCIVRSS